MQAEGRLRSVLPSAGIRPSSRYPVLNEAELGISDTNWAWMQQPIRLFNVAFSWGFMAGVCLCAVLTIVFSPFIGMFISAVSVAYSLIRSCNRAEGRLLTDLFGVSDLIDQSTALMQEEMGVTNEHPVLGSGGFTPAGSNGGYPGSGGVPGTPANGYGTYPVMATGPASAAPLLLSAHPTGVPVGATGNGGASGGGGGASAHPWNPSPLAAPVAHNPMAGGLYQPSMYQPAPGAPPAVGAYPQVPTYSHTQRQGAEDPESYVQKPAQ